MDDTMLANGLDFILNSTEQLRIAEESEDEKERARAYKYSLLHLSAGIELLMKSRLYIDNWTYIVADIDKIDRKKFEADDFVSVDYTKCIERLNKLCGVEIIGDDKQALNDSDVHRCRCYLCGYNANGEETATIVNATSFGDLR